MGRKGDKVKCEVHFCLQCIVHVPSIYLSQNLKLLISKLFSIPVHVNKNTYLGKYSENSITYFVFSIYSQTLKVKTGLY